MLVILQSIRTSGTLSILLGNMALILEIEQLTKTFGGLIALDKVSFDVKAGETLGLIGPNGSGKSTVFNVVTGIFPPDAGKIRLCGEEITSLRAHDIAGRGITRTFQLVKSSPRYRMLPQGGYTGMNLRPVMRRQQQKRKRFLLLSV